MIVVDLSDFDDELDRPLCQSLLFGLPPFPALPYNGLGRDGAHPPPHHFESVG